MARPEACNVCDKKVLRHSYSLRCFLCKCLVHHKCMPCVNREDFSHMSLNHSEWYCSLCITDIFPFIQLLDDTEYMNVISDDNVIPDDNENSNRIPFDLLREQQKLFTPFVLNEDHDSPFTDLDPDIQFYNNHCNSVLNSCDYYIEDSLNAKLENLGVNTECFSLIHANILSAPSKLSKFENYLSNINHIFSIIALSESWIKDSNKDLQNLENYNSEHVFRSNRAGGGVSLFIRNNLDYFIREDLNLNNRN